MPDHWQDIVVKPTVSASAANTGHYPSLDGDAPALVDRLHDAHRQVMVRPYLPAVDTQGETALVYLGGRFSHAVREAALLTRRGERPPVVGDDALTTISPTTESDAELAVARAAFRAAPGGPQALAYARVDLIPHHHGLPLLLEMELTEPSLFLQHAPASAPTARRAPRRANRPRDVTWALWASRQLNLLRKRLTHSGRGCNSSSTSADLAPADSRTTRPG